MAVGDGCPVSSSPSPFLWSRHHATGRDERHHAILVVCVDSTLPLVLGATLAEARSSSASGSGSGGGSSGGLGGGSDHSESDPEPGKDEPRDCAAASSMSSLDGGPSGSGGGPQTIWAVLVRGTGDQIELRACDEDAEDEPIALTTGKSTSRYCIGRGASNDLRVNEKMVSGTHCYVYCTSEHDSPSDGSDGSAVV